MSYVRFNDETLPAATKEAFSKYSSLGKALAQEDYDALRLMIPVLKTQSGWDPNVLDELFVAALNKGRLEGMNLFVELGVNPQKFYSRAHQTFLAWDEIAEVALDNNPDVVFWAIDKGLTRVDHAFSTGDTLLINRVRADDLESVQKLLALGANVNAVNLYEKNALHFAAENANPEMILLLLENNINPNQESLMGGYPSEHLPEEPAAPAVPSVSNPFAGMMGGQDNTLDVLFESMEDYRESYDSGTPIIKDDLRALVKTIQDQRAEAEAEEERKKKKPKM